MSHQIANLEFTPEVVAFMHHCFAYDASFGELVWKYRAESSAQWNSKFAGRIAGMKHYQHGRPAAVIVTVKIFGTKHQIKAHRIIYSMLKTPLSVMQELDHRDGNPLNNRLDNLRLASRMQNMHNIGKKKRNGVYSGLPKGVAKHGPSYRASIMVNRKRIKLGSFSDPELAGKAYRAAAEKHLGEFSRF